ncbi:MAG: F0F1 ATP synthase subunit epsilon [Alphaproteobacteria bacterium]|nr:F0F1 ATP synthase subunit epsilon [Alphaproteobacteria bacterium]
MAEKLHFNLVSPERQLVSEDVDQVDVPGEDGIFGVLPNHAPFMSTLAPGVVRVMNGGKETRVFVRGGFADVTPAGLTVLAEEAVFVADLNAEALSNRIRAAEAAMNDEEALAETRQKAAFEVAQLKELQSSL